MNNLLRTTTKYYLQKFHNGKWLLNVYLIQSDCNENIPVSQVHSIIDSHLIKLEHACISEEFEYYRTGFAFLHYGNRGVDLTIWHYGKWGNTFETYCCSWYCYGRSTNDMELLDSAEPVICQYETLYLIDELNAIKNIVSTDGIAFREKYTNYYLDAVKEKEGLHSNMLSACCS